MRRAMRPCAVRHACARSLSCVLGASQVPPPAPPTPPVTIVIYNNQTAGPTPTPASTSPRARPHAQRTLAFP